jgi:hypothetical protein
MALSSFQRVLWDPLLEFPWNMHKLPLLTNIPLTHSLQLLWQLVRARLFNIIRPIPSLRGHLIRLLLEDLSARHHHHSHITMVRRAIDHGVAIPPRVMKLKPVMASTNANIVPSASIGPAH